MAEGHGCGGRGVRLLAALLALLAGCATVKPPPDENAVVGKLVATTVEALQAPAGRQRDYLVRAQRDHAARPDDASSLCLALLLTALPAPLRDEQRALSLLAPIAARQPETAVTHFARLLSSQLQGQQGEVQDRTEALRRETELRQAGEERERALQRRLETLRAVQGRDAAQLRRLTEALHASEQREETLKRQIDSLRASDRGMIEREEKLAPRTK